MPNRRQAIIWSNVGMLYWRICGSRPQWVEITRLIAIAKQALSIHPSMDQDGANPASSLTGPPYLWQAVFLTRQAVNIGLWEIDSRGCNSLVKIAFAPICACKNNQLIWRYNASTPSSRASQINCGDSQNTKSEWTVPRDNGEISHRQLF